MSLIEGDIGPSDILLGEEGSGDWGLSLTVDALCSDWEISDTALAELWTEPEKPLSLAEGEEGSEGMSKLGTVRIVEALVLPFVTGLGPGLAGAAAERFFLEDFRSLLDLLVSGDAPLALLLFIMPGEAGVCMVFWFASDAELEGGVTVEQMVVINMIPYTFRIPAECPRVFTVDVVRFVFLCYCVVLQG